MVLKLRFLIIEEAADTRLFIPVKKKILHLFDTGCIHHPLFSAFLKKALRIQLFKDGRGAAAGKEGKTLFGFGRI